MNKLNNSGKAQRVVRRLFSDYRIWSLGVFAALTLLWRVPRRHIRMMRVEEALSAVSRHLSTGSG